LSLDGVRDDERAGMMLRVPRLSDGYRRNREPVVEWLCLRETGQPIQHIRRYADLTFTGAETNPERVARLHERRGNLVAQIAGRRHDLEHCEGELADCADTFGVAAREDAP
jgi:DNA-binding transcriptional MerR regulator